MAENPVSPTAQKKRRIKSVEKSTKEIGASLGAIARSDFARIRAISDEEWQAAVDGSELGEGDGPGKGWWGPDKGGTHTPETGKKLTNVPGHVFKRAGQRTGYKIVKAVIRELKQAPVLPASSEQSWHTPLMKKGKLTGLLVGRDSYATTVLGAWGRPREGSWAISLIGEAGDGPGKGWWGPPKGTHSARNIRITQQGLFTGNPIADAKARDVEMLTNAAETVAKSVGMEYDDTHFSLPDVIGGDIMGTATRFKGGEYKGESVILISPRQIMKALDKEGWDTWMGILPETKGGKITYDTLFKHTVAHEIGHRFETTKMSASQISSWKNLVNGQNWNGISGYAKTYKDYREAFADAFAAFTLGYNMPSVYEDWFMDNTTPGV